MDVKSLKAIVIFLTRSCSIRCVHCSVWSRRYGERSPEYWVEGLSKFWSINPKVHAVVLGGEPLEYWGGGGLLKFVELLGRKNYSITSNSVSLTWRLAKELADRNLPNWTVSIDYPLRLAHLDLRTLSGYRALNWFKELSVPDLHVTITIYPHNAKYLPETISDLMKLEVWIEPTVVMWKKADWYDSFPYMNVNFAHDDVNSMKLAMKLLEGYDKAHFMPEMFFDDHLLSLQLSANYRCSRPHVLTFDEDGSMRLCRDIRGRLVTSFSFESLTSSTVDALKMWEADKEEMCMGCNWDCMMMAELGFDKFVHEWGERSV